jgi:hypothetical protein
MPRQDVVPEVVLALLELRVVLVELVEETSVLKM